MRATRIRPLDETLLVVPNSLLVKERLVNLSLPSRAARPRASRWRWPTAATSARVRRLLRGGRAGLAARATTSREPVVLVTRFGDFAVNFVAGVLGPRLPEQGAGPQRGATRTIYDGLRAAGIEIRPLPPASRWRRRPRRHGGMRNDGQGARLRDAQEVGVRSRRAAPSTRRCGRSATRAWPTSARASSSRSRSRPAAERGAAGRRRRSRAACWPTP